MPVDEVTRNQDHLIVVGVSFASNQTVTNRPVLEIYAHLTKSSVTKEVVHKNRHGSTLESEVLSLSLISKEVLRIRLLIGLTQEGSTNSPGTHKLPRDEPRKAYPGEGASQVLRS